MQYVALKLTDEAKRWLITKKTMQETDGARTSSWPNFKQKFLDHFFPRSVRDIRAKEFSNLVQGTIAVHRYATKFLEPSHFASYLVLDEDRKARDYRND